MPKYKQRLVRIVIYLADRLLGIKKLNHAYHKHRFEALPAAAFLEKFVHYFQLDIQYCDAHLNNIPRQGGLLLVANHPLGGVEGVVMAHLLIKQRPDLKILANQALSIFPELSPYFIYTNPLKPNAKGNLTSIRACQQHLKAGGALLIFPAGRVSYYQDDKQIISDHSWHKMVGLLATHLSPPQILPIHIHAFNRKRFYWLGRVYYRFRLLMLIREMLASTGKKVQINIGNTSTNLPPNQNKAAMTHLYKLLTYLQAPNYQQSWPMAKTIDFKSIAIAPSKQNIHSEITGLPHHQKLIEYKNYLVCFANANQIPYTLLEIQRLREITFRQFNEGSGQPKDGDDFDLTYTHLFVYDQKTQSIIGAYRMGQTDQLTQQNALQGLYLSRMFEFSDSFVNRQQACLEMGRSFIVSNERKSYHGLLLLFKGIGAFVCQHPQYKVLYGTVSLSTQYTPLSVCLIEQFLTTPNQQPSVIAKHPYKHPLHPELLAYLKQGDTSLSTLNWLIEQIEPDGKGLPVLVKQYHQLGATFHCLGVDHNFANTPGLLLSVDLRKSPEKLLKLYLGKDYQAFLS